MNQTISYPIKYSIGESSSRTIIHQQDDLFIAHEHLKQDITPTRFYQHKYDIFLFLMKGELYIQQEEQEIVLKQHQGIWLNANTINLITLLSPSIKICQIHFGDENHPKLKQNLTKISSGTVESILGRNKTRVWPLWQGKSGTISIELYPPSYKETLYYQKIATQYVLPIDGEFIILNEKRASEACSSLGKLIARKRPRAILNPNKESITLLSVTTTQTEKGRILILKK